jgi:hypothetical protein
VFVTGIVFVYARPQPIRVERGVTVINRVYSAPTTKSKLDRLSQIMFFSGDSNTYEQGWVTRVECGVNASMFLFVTDIPYK